MTLPNFLIIGGHKCGTTSLYSYLKQHPQIYMPELKEPRFFAYDDTDPVHRAKSRTIFPVRTLAEYQALFDGVTDEKAIGEASPEYLRNTRAARRIRDLIPHAKLIVSLRNPVDRTYSEYLMRVRAGDESRPFEQVCREDRERLQRNLYFDNLKRYTDLFDRAQLKVLLFERFRADPLAVVQECFRFLEVDDTSVPDTTRQYNPGGVPRSRSLYRLLTNGTLRRIGRRMIPKRYHSVFWKMKDKCLKAPPPLTEETRQYLMGYFAKDIQLLEELIGMDLSVWTGGAANGAPPGVCRGAGRDDDAIVAQ